jgi:hypothetical protein
VDLPGRLARGKCLRGPIVPKTANYTCLASDSGTIFTTTGTEGAVNFTLPAVSAGLWFEFIATANYAMLVKTATADTLITFNDVAADSVSYETENGIIGGALICICDGTNWYAADPTVKHTLTVVTA